MYAVITSGGKQYKVKKGDTLQVDLLPLDMGAKTDFNNVLLVGSGAEIKIGQPYVSAAAVVGEVVAIEKGPKIIVYHKRRRKQYEKKVGHRQPFTRLLITSIDNGSGEKETLTAEEKTKILGNVGFASKDAWALDDVNSLEAPAKAKAPKSAKAKTEKAPAKKAAPKKAVSKAKK